MPLLLLVLVLLVLVLLSCRCWCCLLIVWRRQEMEVWCVLRMDALVYYEKYDTERNRPMSVNSMP